MAGGARHMGRRGRRPDLRSKKKRPGRSPAFASDPAFENYGKSDSKRSSKMIGCDPSRQALTLTEIHVPAHPGHGGVGAKAEAEAYVLSGPVGKVDTVTIPAVAWIAAPALRPAQWVAEAIRDAAIVVANQNVIRADLGPATTIIGRDFEQTTVIATSIRRLHRLPVLEIQEDADGIVRNAD